MVNDRLRYTLLKNDFFNNQSELTILFDEKARTRTVSKAQLHQDLFVLDYFKGRRNGYFIEFGAANGKDLSNTYLLEKQFGWTGICAEPARVWHKALIENRSCNIEKACVWNKTGDKLEFWESAESELSTLEMFKETDHHVSKRENGIKYGVETISLNDLLEKYGAPADIEYLSMDTEGSEYDILHAFDFEKYRIEIITVEHNYTPNRSKIFNLLSAKGYQRVLESISEFDDWFIKKQV